MTSPPMRPILLGGLLAIGAIASLTFSRDVHAEPRRKRVSECADAAERAQTLRSQKHPTAARKLALICSREDCPDVVRRDCQTWAAELEAEQTTLVVRARDPQGTALVPTRITIDGSPSADALEGRTLELDPGAHVIIVNVEQRPPVEVRITTAPGERVNRIVDVPNAPPASAAQNSASPPVVLVKKEPLLPTASWISFGLTAAALGSFAYFGVTGNEKLHELRAQCAPQCSDDDLSPARASHLVADISLGVAVASAVAGVWFALRQHRSSTSAAVPAQTASVVPTTGGAAAVVRGEF